MSKLRQVLKLYCQGQSKLQISTLTGLSRNTVKKDIQAFQALRTTLEDVNQLSDKDLDAMFCQEPEPGVDDRLAQVHEFFKLQEGRLKQRGRVFYIRSFLTMIHIVPVELRLCPIYGKMFSGAVWAWCSGMQLLA